MFYLLVHRRKGVRTSRGVVPPGPLCLAPLTREHAEDIATWHYEPPYDVYDMVGADFDELLARGRFPRGSGGWRPDRVPFRC